MRYNTEIITGYSPRFNIIHVKDLLSDILVDEQNSDYTVSRRTNQGANGNLECRFSYFFPKFV